MSTGYYALRYSDRATACSKWASGVCTVEMPVCSLRLHLAIVAVSALIAVNVLFFTGLIGNGDQWYSPESAYRRQTDALCGGQLALSEDPRDLGWDMAWYNGRVQQVWGLGIPLWRLPFELLARLFGIEHFPDRFALATFVAIVAYAVIRVLLPPTLLNRPLLLIRNHPAAVASVSLLLLFPPFIALCRTRFLAYEEAAAYAYLVGLLLLVLTISAARSPQTLSVIYLASVAGFAPFIRPTLLAYSVASLLLVAFQLPRKRSQWHLYALLFAPFSFSALLLLITNCIRFGGPFEFGHAINLNTLDPMRYVTRFQSPFNSEPLLSASMELFSCLFLVGNNFNGRDWYLLGFFPGQSETLRWREFYFTTFDLTYLMLIVHGWVAGGWCYLVKGRTNTMSQSAALIMTLSSWSVLSSIPLVLFYLRFPSVSSRYNIDFAPAFCAALIASFFSIQNWICGKSPEKSWPAVSLCVLFAGWIGWRVNTTGTAFDTIPPMTIAGVSADMIRSHPPASIEVPDEYSVGTSYSYLDLPFNLSGWDLHSGRTKAAISLWVESPKFLEVLITKPSGLGAFKPEIIQAKVGLEYLHLESAIKEGDHVVLRFRGPQYDAYRHGLQIAYLGMVESDEVGEGDSNIQLLRVRWGAGRNLP